MRRWLSGLFIFAYLSALMLGIASQTMKFGAGSHPAMYYFVWDMFCGWAAYEVRYHVIAEGESGKYYWLAPGPWGTFRPFGDLARNHYDYYGNGLLRMASTTLKHTSHEPIRRIISLEEVWAKKYNIPDHLWEYRMDEPKDALSYFWLRNVYAPDGQPIFGQQDFLKQLYTETVFSNPRLQADSTRGRPMFAINPYDRRMLPVNGQHARFEFGSQDDFDPSDRLRETAPSAN